MDRMTFNWDDKLKNYVRDITEQVDCIVLGRKLAQGFIPHWASIPKDEDAWGIDKMNNSRIRRMLFKLEPMTGIILKWQLRKILR